MSSKQNLPTVSQKEAVVLGILLSRCGVPMFGLGLVEESAGLLKRGTVYVTLQRMEEKGLIESTQESRQLPEIGIPRRLYSVTGLGAAAFEKYKKVHQRLSELLALA
jgi:PadR family transcriptional regulator, regulatory protein PadR